MDRPDWHVRWMIRRDHEFAARIAAASFPDPWNEEEFTRRCQDRNVIPKVVEDQNEQVIGYMVYALYSDRIHLLNFAVDPNCRRQGVGTALISHLKAKLTRERRQRIYLETPESFLAAQQFYRSQGFRAYEIKRDQYLIDGELQDGYAFEFWHIEPVAAAA